MFPHNQPQQPIPLQIITPNITRPSSQHILLNEQTELHHC